MVVSSNFFGKQRALLIAIEHVCLGARPKFSGLPDLLFAHRDAEALRKFLIDFHGCDAQDIILMKDDPNHPPDLWPTRKRILSQIDRLTSDVPEGCHFFFYFAGHGIEEECLEVPNTRADGQDDEIVSADGKLILDHDLHKHLIEPLEKVKGCKLFALLDCCHSETMLDLQIGKGPNLYERVWDFGRGELFKVIVRVIIIFLRSSKKHLKKGRVAPRRVNTFGKRSGSPVARCQKFEGLNVICLSACRDRQLAHDARGETFTKCFLQAAEGRPDMTWTELHDAVKREFVSKIQRTYESLHKPCFQDPRYYTTFRTDLTQPMRLWLRESGHD